MNGKRALLFGATGLIGTYVQQLLLNDPAFIEVRSFVRRSTGVQHPKLKEIITDYNNLESVAPDISGGDVAFCCVGTTIKKAGSQAAFEKVDLDIPLNSAAIAKSNGVAHYLVISSLGADASSGNFYLRTKGKMEEELRALGFQNLSILRPSLLTGDRKEFRLGELIGKYAMMLLNPILIGSWRKYRSISAKDVAKAMVRIAKEKSGTEVYESDRLQLLSEQ